MFGGGVIPLQMVKNDSYQLPNTGLSKCANPTGQLSAKILFHFSDNARVDNVGNNDNDIELCGGADSKVCDTAKEWNKTIEWSSGDRAVAIVNASGSGYRFAIYGCVCNNSDRYTTADSSYWRCE